MRSDHAEGTELVKALLYDLREVLDGRLLANRVDCRRMRTKARIGRWSAYLWIWTSPVFSDLLNLSLAVFRRSCYAAIGHQTCCFHSASLPLYRGSCHGLLRFFGHWLFLAFSNFCLPPSSLRQHLELPRAASLSAADAA